MKLLVALALLIPLAGCSQKSDVDKCVETWEATVKDIPDDDQKRVGFYEGELAVPSNKRLVCMQAAGKQNK